VLLLLLLLMMMVLGMPVLVMMLPARTRQLPRRLPWCCVRERARTDSRSSVSQKERQMPRPRVDRDYRRQVSVVRAKSCRSRQS